MLEALVQPLHGGPGMLAQQRHRRTAMARTRFMPALAPLWTILRGQFGQLDQRISHAFHRRDNRHLHGLIACQQQLRHMPVTLGIGNRGATEFMHHGAGGRRWDSGGFKRNDRR